MNQTFSFAALLAALALSAGCTLAVDVDRFKEAQVDSSTGPQQVGQNDELVLRLTGMTAHQNQMLEYRVVGSDNIIYFRGFIKPLGVPTLELRAPGAVPHNDKDFRLDFYADVNNSGDFDGVDSVTMNDHAWRIDPLTKANKEGQVVVEFTHNFDFTDLYQYPNGNQNPAKELFAPTDITLKNIGAAKIVELRVVDTGSKHTAVLYRFPQAKDGDNMKVKGMIEVGNAYVVDVIVDDKTPYCIPNPTVTDAGLVTVFDPSTATPGVCPKLGEERTMSLEPGQVIDGKYKVVKVLGEGGMGVVYEGENVRIKRRVAIKVLHPEIARKTDLVTRFEREAQAAARIGSKHIVDVLDLGDLEDGSRFIVMEFLDGEALADRMQSRGLMSPARAALVSLQVLDGLRKAHEAGIVHRDMKPENVYITKEGDYEVVKILDFGISKFTDSSSESGMTQTGSVMGTPNYMAPEQARGKSVDHRADLYSLGVILYECVSGYLPHSAENVNDLLFKIVLEPPTPLGQVAPDLPADFISIVDKALAREPDDRYQTARELQKALADWLDEHPNDSVMESSPSRASLPDHQRRKTPPIERVKVLTEDPSKRPGGAAAEARMATAGTMMQDRPPQTTTGASIGTVPPAPRSGSKLPLLLGGAGLAAAAVAVFFVTQRSAPPPAAAAQPEKAPVVSAAPAKTETPPAASSTAPKVETPPEPTSTAKPVAGGPAPKPGVGGKAPPSKPDAKPDTPPATPEPPPTAAPTGTSGRTYRKEL
ncbi:MAG: protein kinase [Polyangiaceae bacterium]|nr:protein kinase [Polyangiaceae bacterium]